VNLTKSKTVELQYHKICGEWARVGDIDGKYFQKPGKITISAKPTKGEFSDEL
jgi:hypothetical protein